MTCQAESDAALMNRRHDKTNTLLPQQCERIREGSLPRRVFGVAVGQPVDFVEKNETVIREAFGEGEDVDRINAVAEQQRRARKDLHSLLVASRAPQRRQRGFPRPPIPRQHINRVVIRNGDPCLIFVMACFEAVKSIESNLLGVNVARGVPRLSCPLARHADAREGFGRSGLGFVGRGWAGESVVKANLSRVVLPGSGRGPTRRGRGPRLTRELS